MARQMKEPPMMVDGARVAEYAVLDGQQIPAGHVSVAAGGIPLDLGSVAGVLVAENLAEGGAFLLYCNDRWETLAAAHYADAADARTAANRAYSGLADKWTPSRDLTPEEAAEVESTRAFLRQLAADFPNE